MSTFDLALVAVCLSAAIVAFAVARGRGRAASGFLALLGAQIGASVLTVLDVLPWSVGLGAALLHVWSAILPVFVHRALRRSLASGDVARVRGLVRLLQAMQPGLGHVLPDAPPSTEELRAKLHDPELSERERLDLSASLLYLALAEADLDAAVEHAAAIPLEAAAGPLKLVLARVRAETGDLDGALEAYEAARADFGDGLGARTNLQIVRLQLIAHHGRPDQVDELLDSPSLRVLEDAIRALWLGVARARAGEADRATRHFEDARRLGSTELVRKVAQRRLDHPPAALSAELPPSLLEDARRWGPVPSGADSFFRAAPVSATLVGLLVAVHLMVEQSGGSTDGANLVAWGANVGGLTFGGEPWRMITSGFLHAGWGHLVLNALGAVFLGSQLEERHGGRALWIVFLTGVVLGAAASAWSMTPQVAVGASGGLMGFVGAELVAMVLQRWPAAYRKQQLFGVALVVGLTALIALSSVPVDNYAHGFGFLGGALAMAVLLWVPPLVHLAPLGSLLVMGAAVFALLGNPVRVEARAGSTEVRLPKYWLDQSVADQLRATRAGVPSILIVKTVPVADDLLLARLAYGDFYAEQRATYMPRDIGWRRIDHRVWVASQVMERYDAREIRADVVVSRRDELSVVVLAAYDGSQRDVIAADLVRIAEAVEVVR